MPDFKEIVKEELKEIEKMLIAKNASYGNSALDPLCVFSQQNARDRIRVRIDDKLSRLARGNEFENEDTVKDLIGYLVLLRVSRKFEGLF